MKKIIRFSKFFIPAAVISTLIIIAGVSGYFLKGFNLGVDFQAGLIQEIRLAPAALSITYNQTTNAILSFDRSNLYVVVSGAGIESRTYTFSFNDYPTIGSLAGAMRDSIEGLEVTTAASAQISSQWLLFSSQNNPYLGNTPYVVHYLDPASKAVDISEIRSAMSTMVEGVSIQNLGEPQDRHFMIRVEDKEEGGVKPEQITSALEAHFGKGEVAVLRSDYVGSRFSKDLTDQAGLLLGLTLLIILIYATIRFKPQYAVAAVAAILNDGIVIVGFVVWSRMEFTTSTIAAILTILGYSINNTIVVFDRVRENLKLTPDDDFRDILDRSLTGVLSRTIITTLTTMLAVLALYFFAKGSMHDFALALLVGMISGVYTTLFISSAIVYAWDVGKKKRIAAKQLKAKTVTQ